MLVTDPGAYCAPSGSPGTGANAAGHAGCAARAKAQGPVD